MYESFLISRWENYYSKSTFIVSLIKQEKLTCTVFISCIHSRVFTHVRTYVHVHTYMYVHVHTFLQNCLRLPRYMYPKICNFR